MEFPYPNQKGIKDSEKFLAYNEENNTATVQIDFVSTLFFSPFKFNTLEVSILEMDDNQSKIS